MNKRRELGGLYREVITYEEGSQVGRVTFERVDTAAVTVAARAAAWEETRRRCQADPEHTSMCLGDSDALVFAALGAVTPAFNETETR